MSTLASWWPVGTAIILLFGIGLAAELIDRVDERRKLKEMHAARIAARADSQHAAYLRYGATGNQADFKLGMYGNYPPASLEQSTGQAAESGSRRELLVSMRDRIAKAVSDPDCPPRDLASLTRRLQDIAREIDQLDMQEGYADCQPDALRCTHYVAWGGESVRSSNSCRICAFAEAVDALSVA